nr:MAG TPA: hypothetical protein [Caudoviricetes sp.]
MDTRIINYNKFKFKLMLFTIPITWIYVICYIK